MSLREIRAYQWVCDECKTESEVIHSHMKPSIPSGWEVVRKSPVITEAEERNWRWLRTALLCQSCFEARCQQIQAHGNADRRFA